jgi:hypothetical protein
MLPKGSISKIYKYYFTSPEYGGDVMCALREFFDRPDLERSGSLDMGDEIGEGLFNEWFLYDFKMKNDKTPLENFIARNPFRLGNKEMALYRNLLDNKFGIFEVLSIKRDQGLDLRDLQTDMEWFVYEKSLTHQAKIRDVLFGRIANVGDHYELVGANTFLMDIDEAARKRYRKEKGKITPKEANKIWGRQFSSAGSSVVESKQEILTRRKELEQELVDMLKETESDFELAHVLDAIYNEADNDDMMKVVAMFDRGGDATELENVLELVSDAWNYFPHKILNGFSPNEVILEHQNKREKNANR